jgi:uncharacterized membrane protein YphA (DoxX/SURF4 family)
MEAITVPVILQVIIAAGLLNVWLLRSKSATAYRGGQARSLQDEFAAYGLPVWFFYLVGVLKIGSAILLIVGLWVPAVVLPSVAVIAVLMIGALAMHLKVKDPPLKSLPAFLMLLMSAGLLVLA